MTINRRAPGQKWAGTDTEGLGSIVGTSPHQRRLEATAARLEAKIESARELVEAGLTPEQVERAFEQMEDPNWDGTPDW